IVVFIFFFQAEDGIRDFHVTGVQTCALPICGRGYRAASAADTAALHRGDVDTREAARRGRRGLLDAALVGRQQHRGCSGGGARRSEERRVGKEGRSWWSPKISKKIETSGRGM